MSIRPELGGPRSSSRPWVQNAHSLAGAIAVFAVLELLRLMGYPVAVPETVMVVAVAYAAGVGGQRMGLVATVLGSLYLGGAAFHWTPAPGTQHPARVATFAAAGLVVSGFVGVLHRQARKLVSAEQQQRLQAAALERAKTQVLNIASHELRGPLSVLGGYVSMLGDGSFGPPDAVDMRRALPVLQRKVAEMNALVDSMLESARIEDHRLALARERLDMRDVVRTSVEGVEPMAGPNHQLKWALPADPVYVAGDRARLEIVVTNLIQNAFKYSPNGGLVQVFLTAVDGEALLSVWDHGLGISEQDMPRLFARFGRLLTAENSHINGTGLGLYLSRELARLHGGDLIVSSQPGEGSTFTLRIPLSGTRATDPDRAVAELEGTSRVDGSPPAAAPRLGDSIYERPRTAP